MAVRAPIRFGLLGSLRVLLDGDPVEINAPKQRVFLALLLTGRNRPVTTDQLIEGLWDGKPPATARAALQVYVSQLRKLLGAELISTTTNGYQLNISVDAIDVAVFGALLDEGRRALEGGETTLAVDTLEAALDIWQGPALADFMYSAWAQPEIRRLDELRAEARILLVEARLERGDRGLVAEIEPLVEEYPYREHLRGLLARALYQDGRQVAALRSLEATRRILAEDLGVTPSAGLLAIEQRILEQNRDLDVVTARRESPLIRSSFVGRVQERQEVQKLLADERMVTLTGPGGVGKSRLALEAVTEFVAGGDGDLWWVDLTPVEDSDVLTRHVLLHSGLRQEAQLSARNSLVGGIGTREVTVVLDNCEHLLAAVADLAASLLAQCPGLTLLTTSREPLRLSDESVYAVLPLPTEEAQPALAPAVRLFIDRAFDAYPNAAAADLDAVVVSEICRHLDGLPLAIEIAAARLRDIGLQALADEIGLIRQEDTLPDRLQATIAWSYNLLGQRARLLFESLSVFRGSFDSSAAQAVCANGDLGENEVLDLLSLLVDKSLLTVESTTGGRRYRLLDTIAAFSRRRSEDQAELTARHASHYRDWAIGLRDPIRGGKHQMDLVRQVTMEIPNLRTAFEWSSQHKDPLILHASTAISPYWQASGKWDDAMRIIDLAMDAREMADPCIVVEAMANEASLLDMMEDQERAEAMAQSALEMATTECPEADHHALYALAHANINSRDPALAVAYGERATVRAAEAGDRWTEGWSLLITGTALYELGEPVASLPKLESALDLLLQIGDSFGVGWATWCLGVNARWHGDMALYEERMHDSLLAFTKTEDSWGIGVAAAGLGDGARLRGDYSLANELFAKAFNVSVAAAQTGNGIAAKASLARIALDQSDPEGARTLIRESLDLASSENYWAVVQLALPAAMWMSHAGQADAALPLVLAALHHWDELGLSWEPDIQADWEDLIVRIKSAIGSDGGSEEQVDGVYLTEGDVVSSLKTIFASPR